jgi:hypothetical protein
MILLLWQAFPPMIHSLFLLDIITETSTLSAVPHFLLQYVTAVAHSFYVSQRTAEPY